MNKGELSGASQLYRQFDSADVLLYIGVSHDVESRNKGHAADSSWWGDVARVTIENYATRREALAAERAAIKLEAPIHNVARGKPNRKSEHGSRQFRSQQRKLDAGWERMEVWLSPEDVESLRAAQRAAGASAQEVLRRGVRGDRDAIAVWMVERDYEVGHGDAVEDMLARLEAEARCRPPRGCHSARNHLL